MKALRLLLVILATACSCAEDTPPTSIILVSLDTLRADHLGLYGYERDTSPTLDSLADQAIVFDLTTALPSVLATHALSGSDHDLVVNRNRKFVIVRSAC